MTISIQYRPINIGGQPEHRWIAATSLGEFATTEDAETKADACRRAMPLREYKVVEIDDEDIPF